ncbi:MAG TPA: DEAD/DEAH box helicase family protein [Candidatus Hydrothermia bacterium]|nr:DEAD/DEAH box helicase family protein [Candidatus Hydrothermia bacterium]
MKIFLQDMIEDLRFEDLPPAWNTFDLESFSKDKRLWDYQQNALKNAIKVLWKYFEDFADYKEKENLEINGERRKDFFKWYQDNGLEEDLDIGLDRRKRNIYNLLTEYYPQDNGKIPYEHFINRMSFWMATGSGKSLVIIKLIEILIQLMERKEIPSYDILILTHRDDLIEQLKKHVDEFNYANETKIILKELKEYPEVKRQRTLFGTTVFYYRSDNLSDEQKEKIIDFKNYDNDGRWYIFLDEAHKGDREDSKRQHIYSILSRNGFLFNSSATFIDPRDIATCAFEFNLSSFVNAGYGKHINILKQEIRAFRDEEDYSGEEKQKIVLKSLILLTYVKKFYEDIKNIQSDLYHKPLLLTLVNSVNTEDADLKLFFRELERVGKGEIDPGVLKIAIDELWSELKQEPEFMFEDGIKIKVDETILKSITKDDILSYVYNSDGSGETEVLVRQSDKKELAFKLKTSNRPFALIKIGDISGWLKEELAKYEIQERFEDESYFENLNKEESEINILMGSRGFYEGWDSNRPNVINFINIGMGEDAKKFILQSVGRGVRIEPVKNKRRRLLQLYNSKEIDQNLFDKVKDKVLPIETLFIFGTNRNAIATVVQELEKEKEGEGEAQLSLFENPQIQKDKLLVPKYRPADSPLLKTDKQVQFEVSVEDLKVLSEFGEFITDDRVILMRYNTEPEKVKFLRESLATQNNFKTGEKSFKDMDLLIQRFFDYLGVTPEEFEEFKELEEEIRHFKNIKVYLEDISEIQKKIDKVSQFKDPSQLEKELEEKYNSKEISLKEYTEGIKEAARMVKEEASEYQGMALKIKYIPNHYYLPIILSDDERIGYIKHIIKTPSEVKFVNDLEDYLEKPNNKFKDFDWWFFSKLDESLDEIYIPYYNPNVNKISRFYPDFIFWFKKGDNYFIVFVDPKGTEHTSAYRKIDWYKKLFEKEGEEEVFNYNGLKVKIKLLLRPDDVSKASREYRRYWFDNIEGMLKMI